MRSAEPRGRDPACGLLTEEPRARQNNTRRKAPHGKQGRAPPRPSKGGARPGQRRATKCAGQLLPCFLLLLLDDTSALELAPFRSFPRRSCCTTSLHGAPVDKPFDAAAPDDGHTPSVGQGQQREAVDVSLKCFRHIVLRCLYRLKRRRKIE